MIVGGMWVQPIGIGLMLMADDFLGTAVAMALLGLPPEIVSVAIRPAYASIPTIPAPITTRATLTPAMLPASTAPSVRTTVRGWRGSVARRPVFRPSRTRDPRLRRSNHQPLVAPGAAR